MAFNTEYSYVELLNQKAQVLLAEFAELNPEDEGFRKTYNWLKEFRNEIGRISGTDIHRRVFEKTQLLTAEVEAKLNEEEARSEKEKASSRSVMGNVT